MDKNAMLSKYLGQNPPSEEPAPKKLTSTQMQHWNGFVDFLDSKGYKGSKDFDNKDQKLGQLAMDSYKKQNPDFSLTLANIPAVQKGILETREHAISQLKTGKATLEKGLDAGKDYQNFMPNLSKPDGWLGSKTSSHKFPESFLNEYENGQKVTDMKPMGFVSANK